MKKKFLSLLCAAAMMCSLAACGTAADTTYAGQTLTGRVTAIDGTTVTMQLGELTETAAPTDNSGSGDSQQPTGTPPEKPDGDTSTGSSQHPPDMPDRDSQNDQGGTPPDMPGGMPGGTSFTEGDETAAVELSKAAITRDGETVTASDVAVDDILTVTFDDSGIAAKAEIVTVGGGMGGPGGSFGGSSTVTQGDSANTISENGAYSDTISTLNMTLTNGSSFTGTVNIADNAQNGTAVSDNAVVTIGSGCTWTLTGSCTLTSLTNNGTINFNGYTITLADGTVLR